MTVMQQMATVSIRWESYSNEDLGDDEPDEGWYVSVTTPNGRDYDIGPDFYGPGFKTFDEALAQVVKWANGRRFVVDVKSFTLPVYKRLTVEQSGRQP